MMKPALQSDGPTLGPRPTANQIKVGDFLECSNGTGRSSWHKVAQVVPDQDASLVTLIIEGGCFTVRRTRSLNYMPASLLAKYPAPDLNNFHTMYALTYCLTIEQAIAQRDEPMDREACILAFQEAAGRHPLADEIQAMRPDSQETINRQRAYYAD